MAAGFVLGALAGAGPLYTSSVATALVERELERFHDENLGLTVATFAPAATQAGLEAADAEVATAAAGIEGLSPVEVFHSFGVEVGGRSASPDGSTYANVLTRTEGVERLPLNAGERGPGVFARDDFAAVGDELELTFLGFRGLGEENEPTAKTVTVTGTYPPFQRFSAEGMDPYWLQIANFLVPSSDRPDADVPPPALIVDPGTFTALAGELAADVPAEWTAALDVPNLTYEGLQRLLPAYAELSAEVVDPTTQLGAAVDNIGIPSANARTESSLEPLAERVIANVVALEGPVRAVGVGGQALAVVVLTAAGIAAARRRSGELRLAVTRGVSPLRLGAAAAVPAVAPVAGGALLGWAAAVGFTILLGPASRLDPEATTTALGALPIPLGAGLLLLAVGTAVEAARAGRVLASGSERRRRLRVPVDMVAGVAAAAVGWQLRDRSPVIQTDGGVPELDLLLLSFPLLVLVALAGLGARVFTVAVRSLRRLPLERTAGVYLASRRLAGSGTAPLLLVAVGGVALGTLVFAGTLVTSTNATIEEKAGLLVGADLSVPLPRADRTFNLIDFDAFSEIPHTTVRRAEARWLPSGSEEGFDADVLVVDPDRFAEVALPSEDMGRSELAAAMAQIDEPETGIEAIVTGALPGQQARLAFVDDLALDVTVATRVEAFPGMTGERPMVVIPDDAYDTLATDIGARTLLATNTDPLLWARGETSAVLDAVERAAPEPEGGSYFALFNLDDISTVDEFAERPGVAAITSTFTLLQVQAAFAGVLTLVALLLYQQVSARRRRLSEAFAARMGFSRSARLRAAALEPAVLLGAAVVIGTLGGLAVARLVLTTYDPVPDLAVPPLLAVPALLLVVVAAVALVAVAVSAVTRGTPSGQRVAELLRVGA